MIVSVTVSNPYPHFLLTLCFSGQETISGLSFWRWTLTSNAYWIDGPPWYWRLSLKTDSSVSKAKLALSAMVFNLNATLQLNQFHSLFGVEIQSKTPSSSWRQNESKISIITDSAPFWRRPERQHVHCVELDAMQCVLFNLNWSIDLNTNSIRH